MRVVVLSGGVGGARFTRGLLAHLAAAPGGPHEVTVVANTGDDMWLHGVRVCPDLDTVMYTLAGVVHEEQGWGRRQESTRVATDLSGYGLGWEWFTLGDLDLATCLARTELLRAGRPLSAVTARLAARWELGVQLLPMSDTEVETHVRLADGRLIHFEEWWVRHRARLPAVGFEQVGVADARPAPGVLEAVAAADVLVLPPSNPVVSIGTILGVPGLREAVATGPAPVIGVSPIIGGAPVRGMADACLTAIGVETSAAGVARHYGQRSAGGLLDGWLVDTADAAVVDQLRAEGWTAAAAPTLMRDVATTARIARDALALLAPIS
jgi:LPPG:FO 2-phospho-L-lactate transferase